MKISVDGHPQHLTMLLFIRHAWAIAKDTDIPELSPVPAIGKSRIPSHPDRDIWEARSKTAWERSWAWYANRTAEASQPTQEEMHNLSRPGQDLHPVVPPFWAVEHGTAGFDLEAFNTWDRLIQPPFPSRSERNSTTALVEAWEGGLKVITVLPYRGYFAQRLSESHLVVSAETRQNQELYNRAVSTQP